MKREILFFIVLAFFGSCTITKNGTKVVDVKAPSINIGKNK